MWLEWLADRRSDGAGDQRVDDLLDFLNILIFKDDPSKSITRPQREELRTYVKTRYGVHSLAALSHGERAMLQILGRTLTHMTSNTIILIDEIEIHLHTRWMNRMFRSDERTASEVHCPHTDIHNAQPRADARLPAQREGRRLGQGWPLDRKRYPVMANLSQISDTAELDNKYIGKVVVYVEAESDANLFEVLVGPGHAERIEFKTTPEGGNGCGPTTARVKRERVTNRKVFGLIDGEAATSSHLGFEKMLSCVEPTFVVDDPELEGVLFLADHEAENILLRHSDVCHFIVNDTPLAGMKSRTADEVRKYINGIVDRYFSSAICKYTSARLHSANAMAGILDSGMFFNDLSRSKFLKLLQAKVVAAGCSWEDFRTELDTLRGLIETRFATMEDELKEEERKRLSDGKSALARIKHQFGVSKSWEGHLANELAGLPYAAEFRESVFRRTGL
ncbi:ATP-binding protein (plasmid) [Rhizobium sp. RCAM05350]|nr:ATP-binding protein [Rhizobium sp. RCAM05350]